MDKARMMPIHCSLCLAKHEGQPVKDGWFAAYKTDKRVKIKRLICPDCLDKLGIKRN